MVLDGIDSECVDYDYTVLVMAQLMRPFITCDKSRRAVCRRLFTPPHHVPHVREQEAKLMG